MSETINWDVPELDDCADEINEHVNAVLTEAKARHGEKREDLILSVYQELGASAAIAKAKIETWLESTLRPDQIWQPRQEETKYAGLSTGSWSAVRKVFGPLVDKVLGPTIRVNGIYIGTDKIGHFFAQGFDYFKREVQNDMTREEIEAWGRMTELTIYGSMTTGVYSMADLEANRSGYTFFQRLFSAREIERFDIRDYVTPKWNEVVNPNLYSAEVGPIVWRNLLSGRWRVQPLLPTPQAAFEIVLTADPKLKVTGEFNRGGVAGRVEGSVAFVWKSMKHLNIEIIGYSSSKPLLIAGTRIDLSWQWGSQEGEGFWFSENEVTLEGKMRGEKGSEETWRLDRIPERHGRFPAG